MVQPLSRGSKPRSKTVLHPVPWPKQNDTGGLQEEHAEIAIAAFGDAPEDRSITGGYLLGDQTEPSSKIAAAREGSSVADRGEPFLTLRTASVPASKSIWSHRRSTSSIARKPWR